MAEAVGQFFDAEGKPLAGEALTQAWQSGAAHVAAGTHVHMLDANGDLRLVPADHVAAARAKGYAPAPSETVEAHDLQKAHGGLAEQAKTVAESAADMATIGGYGYAAGKLSPEYGKNVLARREANPYSHVAGSVIGLAPSLLDGGAEVEAGELAAKGAEAGGAAHAAEGATAAPGLLRQGLSAANTVAAAPLKAVGKIGGVVERGIQRGLESLGADGSTLAGRVAAKVAKTGGAGAAEGAVFGVGSTLSDNSLEGKDLTSEALVSGIGRNALFGGALGAGMGALGELGSAAIHGILPDSEKLAKFGREQGMRSIGANGKDIQKLGGKLDMTADELMGYEFKTGENAGKRMFSAASNAKEMAENLAQASAETGAAKRGIVQEINEAIESNPEVAAVAQPDVNDLFQRIESGVLDKLRTSDVMADRRLVKTIEREYEPLRAAAQAVDEHAAAVADGFQGPAPPPITFARLDEFEQRLGKRIYGENVKGAGIQVAPKGAKQLERVRGILSSFQDETAQKALAAMGEDPAQFATLNRQYSTLSSLKKIADRTAGRMDANRMANPTDHALGMGGMLLSMLSGGTGALGAMAYGGAAAVANKLMRERGNSVLADIAYRTSKMDNLVENTAQALSLSPERLAQPLEAAEQIAHHKGREELAESNYVPLGLKALGKDYDETSDRVKAMADPAVQQAQLTVATGHVATHFPEQGAAMTQKLQAVHQYLGSVVPEATGGSVLSPMAVKPRVSPREQQRFLTRVNAALNPASVIKDIGDGKLDKDAVDTLKAVYPATFQLLKSKVQKYTATNKSEMPYARTIHIGNVFGFDADSSMGPRLAGIQQAIQGIGQQPGKPPGAPGPTKRGNPGKSKLGSSFSLPGQASPGAH